MRILLLHILLFSSQLLSAQIMFEKTLHDAVSLSAQCAEPLPDGGYIACGATLGATRYNPTLIRLDSAGNVLWSKTYAGFVDQFGMDVKPVSSGGFVILVQKQQSTAYEAMVIRTDSAGNVIWQQSYSGPGDEEVKEIFETSDGGFLICVQSNSYGFHPGATLIKTDAAGAVQWRKNYRGALGAVGCSAKEVPSGGYVLTGRIIDTVNGIVNDVMVVRVDANGNVIWSTTFGGIDSDEPSDIEVTADNGFMVAGRLYGYGAGGTDIFLSRLDSAGNLLWTKTYGGFGYESTFDMDITSDSGVIIGCWTTSFTSGGTDDYYLIRTDANGDTLWTSTSSIATASGHFMWNVAESSDGGFMCSGEAYLSSNFQYVMYLVKTGSSGTTACNKQGTPTTVTTITLPISGVNVYVINGSAVTTTAITTGNFTFTDSVYCTNVGITEWHQEANQISLFPCPTNSYVTVSSEDYLQNARITICNSFGQIVHEHNNFNGYSVNIDCSALASGMYFLSVTDAAHLPCTKEVTIINN